ncbi:MAG: transcriptional regulator [Halobacteriales archaeon SW_9_67_25]|jgi:DNA-binding Lrp family transcriptional regulator|nr:MAG: transcriptional regulator [Halobacteriales archaeon SW_9_67_25]
MVRAYVTVKAHTGDADTIRDAIAAVEGVERAHIVAGDIDLIAVVDVDSPAAVKDVAATHIQNIEGVADTQTYIAME